jgi:hypothetical protein
MLSRYSSPVIGRVTVLGAVVSTLISPPSSLASEKQPRSPSSEREINAS